MPSGHVRTGVKVEAKGSSALIAFWGSENDR